MSDLHRENRRLWNEWSEDFQARWNANTADGELPPAPSPLGPDAPGGRKPDVLGSVEGRNCAELGCGGGQGSVGTADLGADTVVGVDFSGEQLEHARKLRDFYGVDARFVQGDVTDLPLAAGRFDAAFSVAAFQMVERLDEALAEARRVLRDGGAFVLGVPHPFYELLDDESGTVEGDYFGDGPREITIDEAYESTMLVFDRTVADLHGGLEAAGFDVRHVVEHQRHAVENGDPADSDLPEVLFRVPQSVRFWAVAE